MNNLLCMTANITLAENNETGNDLFRRHAVYGLSFLWKQISNDYFWIPCYKHRRHSTDLISLLSHIVPSTTVVLPWEELFYSLVNRELRPELSVTLSQLYPPRDHFRRVRKTAKTDYWLRPVCLSVRNGKTRILLEDCNEIWIFFENLPRIFKCSLKSEKNREYFTRRPIYIFDHISLSCS